MHQLLLFDGVLLFRSAPPGLALTDQFRKELSVLVQNAKRDGTIGGSSAEHEAVPEE